MTSLMDSGIQQKVGWGKQQDTLMCPIFVFFVSERRQGVSFVLHIQFTAHQLFLSMVPVYPCELVCNPYYLESIKIRFYVTIDNL